MFSKEESKKLRQEFWISFGKSYPRKWVLYNTKVKGLIFRFHFDLKKAMVSLDVEHPDLEVRIALWEKIVSLRSILKEEFLSSSTFEDCFLLENGKELSRVYVVLNRVSIHNKNTWRETMVFLNQSMISFERFFYEYQEMLSD
ncbi:MAG: DUF4268 domain-containing protein [Maribacter sp.]